MLLLGALLILAFPAPNLEFLAWFGLVPGLVLIVRSPTAREGGMRAWWLGAEYLIAALCWMTPEIGPAVLLVGAVVLSLFLKEVPLRMMSGNQARAQAEAATAEAATTVAAEVG